MRVLFLHFGKLHVNSVIQAFHLGEEMTAAGIEVALCGQGPTDRIEAVGRAQLRRDRTTRGSTGCCRAWAESPARPWSAPGPPASSSGKATERAAAALDAPYVVHLEDNEEHLISALRCKAPYEESAAVPPERQDELCAR